MKTNELQKLKERQLAYNAKWSEGKKLLRMYNCPSCNKPNQTPMPTRKDVSGKGYWDSLTTCYECGDCYFVIKYPKSLMLPHGKILIRTIDGVDHDADIQAESQPKSNIDKLVDLL